MNERRPVSKFLTDIAFLIAYNCVSEDYGTMLSALAAYWARFIPDGLSMARATVEFNGRFVTSDVTSPTWGVLHPNSQSGNTKLSVDRCRSLSSARF